jgi:hypothetical protein
MAQNVAEIQWKMLGSAGVSQNKKFKDAKLHE